MYVDDFHKIYNLAIRGQFVHVNCTVFARGTVVLEQETGGCPWGLLAPSGAFRILYIKQHLTSLQYSMLPLNLWSDINLVQKSLNCHCLKLFLLAFPKRKGSVGIIIILYHNREGILFSI